LKFLHRHKRLFFTLIVIICVLAIGVTAGYKAGITPVQDAVGFVITPLLGALSSSAEWVSGKIDFLAGLSSIASENERLKAEVEDLRIEITRLKLLGEENEHLAALIEMDRKYIKYPKTGASVISKDPGNWFNIFLINKGTKDNVRKDMAVLGEGGLIGRVLYAGYNFARVISIIDDTSSVNVKNSRTGDTGFLRGDAKLMLEGLCRMDLIDKDAEIMADDEIVTSQFSDIYPPGIVIGYVTEVTLSGNGTKTAIIKPYIDFGHLSDVLVITELFEQTLID